MPNFVVQGSNSRCDGSGSTCYTLRSKLAHLSYEAGAVGLSSAGKYTSEIFITYLPTPHLVGYARFLRN